MFLHSSRGASPIGPRGGYAGPGPELPRLEPGFTSHESLLDPEARMPSATWQGKPGLHLAHEGHPGYPGHECKVGSSSQ